MRLSLIFELLLIFLLIALSAYARVIDQNDATLHRSVRAANKKHQNSMAITLPSLKQAEETMNKHCTCHEHICSCCREFHIPLVGLNGPGCATLQYITGDNLHVQLSYGNNVLTSGTISGKNPKPICVNLPGGYSKFCGKVYSIKKESDRHFKACLGLELQSSNELEASLRVSCFRFGPDGFKLRPAEEFPIVTTSAPVEDDDDDDLFGLGDDDDEDDEDEEEDDIRPEGNVASNPVGEEDEDEEDDEDDDVLGFEALLDIFTGDDDTTKKPKVTTPLPIISPIIILTTPPNTITPEANLANQVTQDIAQETAQSGNNLSQKKPEEAVTEKSESESVTEMTIDDNTGTEVENIEGITETSVQEGNEPKKPESSEQVEQETVKPEKVTIVKKKVSTKPSVTSSSTNAIVNEVKKPLVRPSTPDPAINDVIPHEEHEDEDEEDEDDILGTEDLDEEDDEDEEEKDETEDDEEENDDEEHDDADNEEVEDTKDEDLEEELDEDDDEEEEEEVEALSALVESDEKTKTSKNKKKVKESNKVNEAGNQEEDDADYGYSLAELLARQVPRRSRGRESKVMRL